MIGGLLLLAATPVSNSAAPAIPDAAALGEQCFYEDKPIRLFGAVSRRTFYGPPNFGENPKTDERDSVYVFRPAKPLLPCSPSDFDNANGDNGSPVRELVIVPFGKPHRLGRQWLTGAISHSVTASQFLDYVFDVE